MSLFRLMELAAQVETVPGTLVTSLFAAGNAKHLVIDPSIEYDVPLFERPIKRGSLTPLEGLTGIKQGTATFAIEVAGDSTLAVGGTGSPPWEIFLRSCGLQTGALYRIAIGAVTGGPFRTGEIVTSSDATAAQGIVIHDTYDGASYLYIIDYRNTGGAAAVWTGADSGATATASAVPQACGRGYRPVSQPTILLSKAAGINGTLVVGDILVMSDDSASGVIVNINDTGATDIVYVRLYNGWPNTGAGLKFGEIGAPGVDYFDMDGATRAQWDIPTLSIGLNEDGVLKQLSGCRGSVSFEHRIGEPSLMRFSFTGKVEDPADTGLLGASVTYQTKVPPVFLSASILVGHEDVAGTYAPRVSTINLDMGNQVSMRQDANLAQGVSTAEIVSRAGSGSMDPEADLETSYPVIQDWLDGDIARVEYDVGTEATNKFHFSAGGLQFNGASSGDRNGFLIRTWNFRLTGGHFSNASDAYGTDNDMALTYLTRV